MIQFSESALYNNITQSNVFDLIINDKVASRL